MLMNDDNNITADQQYQLQQEELQQKIKEFDANMQLQKDKQEFERKKHNDDVTLKKMQIKKSSKK